ncbi:MAG: LacI family transcriptional regulator [Lachnospiraceae bacterium]|nr:LacI family transcriptional regulator [Lachnospiraceae bacterium]
MAATMKDLARATGLGLATISSYFNGGNVREKNRAKIEQAIEELHFEVNEIARGLKTNRTRVIGIVIPELNNIFCAEVITEVEDTLRSHGYAVMVCDCRTDEKREAEAVDFLYHRRVDGLLLMPVGKTGAHLRPFTASGKPVVLIDRRLEGVDCDCVLVDNRGAAADAVRRLIAAGHRQIGILAGPEEIYTARERLSGCSKALEEAGIVQEARLTARGDYTIRGGAEAMKQLLEHNPKMTAVFVSNYEMTMGAVIAANELGLRIPEDLSVIGFDNLEFARASSPRLSIVSQPTGEIGRQAAALLLDRLGEKEISPDAGAGGTERKGRQQPGRVVSLATSFIEGKSVKDLGGSDETISDGH